MKLEANRHSDEGWKCVTHDNDIELARRIRAGDRVAFRQLVEEYQERMFGVALGIVRNSEDAMDITQEAFLKVHQKIERFEGGSRLYTWMYRIVVNLCIDHTRRTRKRKPVVYDDHVMLRDEEHVRGSEIAPIRLPSPDQALGRKELIRSVERALGKLSPNHRQVIVLREVEGLSYKEIANILEVSVGTVMSRLHHARQNMQSTLKRRLG